MENKEKNKGQEVIEVIKFIVAVVALGIVAYVFLK